MDIVNKQVESVPVQSPLQPANVEPESATAVSLTLVPNAMVAEHVGPQFIAEGALVIAPVPVPAFKTARLNHCPARTGQV
ncbi:hypothetical protein MBAV_004515 [Candidatus Magnetobacterium bavaricum]|uniref:Uncharacterized protein n=1 Tax=Candidatus Magnetobacterium bavaricum TaxID=29290 RepID=A0A0F3GMW9_9BACT|nr:hypothetical protein MBAV_004515 [Candidatus Magnetobacterium bavaricum]